MNQSQPPELKVGNIIAGKYRVERILGQGAMGMVVAAMHIDLHERRAIKFMLPTALGDNDGVERFLREARACAKLKSKHVAAVYDVGRLETGAPYIVMEYLEGTDLKDVLQVQRVLPVPQAVDYMLQALEAVGEAHQAGIVHRDLKPANMYLASGVGGVPCIKILDFGIAKLAPSPAFGPEIQEMTTTAMIMGSPLYMSPEQMRSSRHVDARSDIWALGVVLFRMVTGTTPFHAPTPPELFAMVLKDAAPRPSSLNPQIPPGFEAIILKCLDKDPNQRWSSAAELADALRPYSTQNVAATSKMQPAEVATQIWRPPSPSIPDGSSNTGTVHAGASASTRNSANERLSASGSVHGQTTPPTSEGGTIALSSQPGSPTPYPLSQTGSNPAMSLSWTDSRSHSNGAPLPMGGTHVIGSKGALAATSESGLSGQTSRSWSPNSTPIAPPQNKSHVIAISVALGGLFFFAGIALLLFMRNGESSQPTSHSTAMPTVTASVPPANPVVTPLEPSSPPPLVEAPLQAPVASASSKPLVSTARPLTTSPIKAPAQPSTTANKPPPTPPPDDNPFANASRRPRKP
ncbi:MAG: protein kinase [Polyangiaceae bacterium]|nr:protein kinase [Polyangiaceae bacterium]